MSQRDDSRYWFGMDKHTVPQGSQYWEDKRTGMDKHRQKPDEEIENPENIDFSFVCMAAEINMDKKKLKKSSNLKRKKEFNNIITLNIGLSLMETKTNYYKIVKRTWNF